MSNNESTANKKTKYEFKGFSASQIQLMLDEWILSKRDRLICQMKFIDGMTYEQIAESDEVDIVSDRQVRNIVKKCDTEIRKHIDSCIEGVDFKLMENE